MTSIPSNPKIDRITHIDNLASIATGNDLMSDAKRIASSTTEDAIQKVYEWDSRKQMFEPRHVQLAWKKLHQAGWIG